MTANLASMKSWLSYYEDEARRVDFSNKSTIQKARRSLLQSRLEKYVEKSIKTRSNVLRQGDLYASICIGAGAAGLIPFGKTVAKWGGSTYFRDEMTRYLGMSEAQSGFEAVMNIVVEFIMEQTDEPPADVFTKSARVRVAKQLKQDLMDIWQEQRKDVLVGDLLFLDCGDNLAGEAVDELIHIIPIIGNIISCRQGLEKTQNKLNMDIKLLEKFAMTFHKEIFVAAVVEKLLPSTVKAVVEREKTVVFAEDKALKSDRKRKSTSNSSTRKPSRVSNVAYQIKNGKQYEMKVYAPSVTSELIKSPQTISVPSRSVQNRGPAFSAHLYSTFQHLLNTTINAATFFLAAFLVYIIDTIFIKCCDSAVAGYYVLVIFVLPLNVLFLKQYTPFGTVFTLIGQFLRVFRSVLCLVLTTLRWIFLLSLGMIIGATISAMAVGDIDVTKSTVLTMVTAGAIFMYFV